MIGRRSFRRSMLAGFAAGLFLPLAAAREVRAIDILFPAYANPCCGGGPAMWTQLIATAATPGRPYALHVIFNPASGPGVARDPNYLNANGQGPLESLHAADSIVYGYVATGYGARSSSTVMADIDAYLVGHYAGFVDGLFFDEVSSDLALVAQNESYVAHARSLVPGIPTIGNPGITAVQNPSGQTTQNAFDYAAVFDILVTFEQSGIAYRTSYTPPVYLAAKPASGFAHLIHSDGAFDPSLLPLAASRKAGLLFVTDDILPNPYDALPTGWTALLAAVAAFEAPPVPLASPLFRIGAGLAMLGMGTWASAARRSFRTRRSQAPGLRRADANARTRERTNARTRER